jgi:hypothetical protein
MWQLANDKWGKSFSDSLHERKPSTALEFLENKLAVTYTILFFFKLKGAVIRTLNRTSLNLLRCTIGAIKTFVLQWPFQGNNSVAGISFLRKHPLYFPFTINWRTDLIIRLGFFSVSRCSIFHWKDQKTSCQN